MKRLHKGFLAAGGFLLLIAVLSDGIIFRFAPSPSSTSPSEKAQKQHNPVESSNDTARSLPSSYYEKNASSVWLPPQTRPTIVVQLSGEMGNHISKLAHGYGLILWLERLVRRDLQFENKERAMANSSNATSFLDVQLVLRHQTKTHKWLKGQQALHQCFPLLRPLDVSQGNTPEFDWSMEQQRLVLGREVHERFHDAINRVSTADQIEPILKDFLTTTMDPTLHRNRSTSFASSAETAFLFRSPSSSNMTNINRNITLPFLYSDRFVLCDAFMDQFYDEYRQLFAWDDAACCGLLPEPDESVFHFRNFLAELWKKGRQKGYEELSPNQTAHELFGHLSAGEKVAIVTRYDAHDAVQPYVDALQQQRGLQVRVVTNQTDVQDFCFLMHAQKELVGVARSTFLLWAGILGNCTRVRAYSIDSPHRRRAGLENGVFDYYNWTHPDLQNRFFFELYNVDSNNTADL